MKSKVTAILLAVLAVLAPKTMRADVIWQELFNYTNGAINLTSTNGLPPGQTNWILHSGSSDDFVNNRRLENQQSARSGDVHRFFNGSYTNSPIPVYASFVLNCTNLPNAAGTYFAHFYTNSATFQGRLFALAGTNLCLPGTFRLGVSGAQGTVSGIFPIDLATNKDYQVVFEWDPAVNFQAKLWVNPTSSSDTPASSSDIISGTPTPTLAFGFRQASSSGNCFLTVSNLVTATTFEEASTNVWASNSVPPSIVYDLSPVTNYVAVPAQLAVVAAGQGLSTFTYYWKKDGADFPNPNGNSNILPFASPLLSDIGNYSVIVSNSVNGLTVASSTVLMWVTNGPPIILVQPTNQTFYAGKNINIAVTAVATPPLAYSWTFGNLPATNAAVDPTTTNMAVLVINGAQATNVGNYKCLISNPYGSTNTATAALSLLTPQIVNIDTLRGMVDSTFFLPTNTALYYTVTNAVVYTLEVTNNDGSVNGGPFTSTSPSGNLQFFIQDGTGGIAVFDFGAGSGLQPRRGDIVNVTGPLGNFNSLLQFNLTGSDPSQSFTIVGHTNTLPAPVVLPFSFTNGVGFVSVSNVIRKYEGRLVTLTNVYFSNYALGANFSSGNTVLTNLGGERFVMFLNGANVNLIGKPIPQFAAKITGPMSYFLSTTATDRSSGFEIDPSDYADIVAPAPVVGVSYDNITGAPTLSWTPVGGYTYSVLWTTNLTVPFVPIATGLTTSPFIDTVNVALPASFYKITSP